MPLQTNANVAQLTTEGFPIIVVGTCDPATGIDASCDIAASKSDDNVSENEDDHYDFESSLSDEMAADSCACPNFPRHKWDNVRNRRKGL